MVQEEELIEEFDEEDDVDGDVIYSQYIEPVKEDPEREWERRCKRALFALQNGRGNGNIPFGLIERILEGKS